MNKKILASLLALLMAGSMALTSCGGSGDSGSNAGNDTAADTTTAAETVPEETKPQLELPEGIDLKGDEINIAVQQSAGWVQQRDFKFSDEASGEPINDAAKERIQLVEDMLNCKIVSIEVGASAAVATSARTEIMAGGDSYDVIMPGMANINTLGTEGLLMDLYTIDNIDTTKPWWSQQVTKHLSIAGKLYFTLGDLSLIDNDGIGAIGFNKKLVEDYNLDSPYQYVFDGTWTMDKLFKMANAVVKDLNGDGTMDANDQYGFVNDGQNLMYHVIGGGVNLTDKDENDLPVCKLNNERTIQIIDSFINFISGGDAFAQTSLFGGHEPCNTNFMNDQMLFRMTTMYRFTQMRNMETDFGFVTTPKFDESQDSYHHGYSYASPGTAIPVTVKDPEAVGAAVEALSYYGRELMLPAYYDVTLQGKVARDDESAAVLDILFDTAMLDLGTLYNFGGIRDIWVGMVNNKSNTFVSSFEAISGNVDKAIADLVETVEALD
nr:extracellular solute-binding protein [Clostridia bacterium]